MINCFDVESLSVLQKYRFKQTFLIGENVEEFIFDKPFVDERLRSSEYFLKDVQQGILSLENFIKINKIKTFNELTKKRSMFAFECFETENYEKTVSKECLPIFCRFILDRRLAKDGYFGGTQKFTQNNKEAILVTVYECNFVYETGLQNHYTTENFIQSLKYRFQPSFVYRSNYVHEFQHVIQIVHNLCNENQYDLDGDLDKILGSDDFNVYYSVATEKEAFFIQILNLVSEKKGLNNFNSFDDLKMNLIGAMKQIGLFKPEQTFAIFEDPLKKYFNSVSINESLSESDVKHVRKTIHSKNVEGVLKVSDILKKMTNDELRNEFKRFLRNGVK